MLDNHRVMANKLQQNFTKLNVFFFAISVLANAFDIIL
jgi:hypothetical protein